MSDLLVKLRGPRSSVSTSVSPNMSFGDFKVLVARLLAIEEDIDLLKGFPPAVLDLNINESIREHVNHNDSIRAQVSVLCGVQKQGAAKPRKTSVPAANARGSSRGIATLDNRKGKSTMQTGSSSSIQFGARVASLGNPSGRQRARLTQPRRRGLAVRAENSAHNVEDISDHLIAAASGAAGGRSRVLRSVFRKAVEHQYHAAQALARLYSVYGQSYHFSLDGSGSRVLGEGTILKKLTVTYRKGLGHRGSFCDEVDLIPKDVLKSLLRVPVEQHAEESTNADAALDREVLKPINLAKASPRIFWSLVYHHGNDLTTSIHSAISDIDSGDWLLERKRELSEKAKENKRQREEVTAGHSKKLKSIESVRGLSEPTKATESNAEAYIGALAQAVSGLRLSAVIAPEYVAALQNAVECDALPVLAASDAKALLDRCTSTLLTQDQVAFYVASAQRRIHDVVYHFILAGSHKIKVLLGRLRVHCLKDLLVWSGAADALHAGLMQFDSSLGLLEISGPPPLGRTAFGANVVSWMLQNGNEAILNWPFLRHIDASEDEMDECVLWEEAEALITEDADIWADTWEFHPAANEHVGKRVRLYLRHEEMQEEDGDGQEGCSEERLSSTQPTYWEDGTVIAYLPPSPDEPMALWRVRLDGLDSKKSIKVGRFEDLELHQLTAVMANIVP